MIYRDFSTKQVIHWIIGKSHDWKKNTNGPDLLGLGQGALDLGCSPWAMAQVGGRGQCRTQQAEAHPDVCRPSDLAREAGSTKPAGRVVYLLRKEQRRGRGPWRGDFRRGDGKEVLGRRDLAGLGAGMELQRREDVLRLGGAGLAEETRRRGQDGGGHGGDQLMFMEAQWRARERQRGGARDDDDGARSVASGFGGNKRGRCYKCGERGHFKRDCPQWKKAPAAERALLVDGDVEDAGLL